MSFMDNQESSQPRQRGRPRKTIPTFRFHSYVYNSPLGCQYTQPMVVNMSYTNTVNNVLHSYNKPIKTQERASSIVYSKSYNKESLETSPTAATSMRREKRTASIKVSTKKKKKIHSEDSISDEEENHESNQEEELFERLLDYNETEDKFYVKLRNMSYIHCIWVPRSEILETRAGLLKIKKFKKVEISDDFVTVERIVHENDQRWFLVKWKKLPYEMSTFETQSDAEKCVGFDEELKNFRDRKKMQHMRFSLDWRPNRENQTKFGEGKIFKNNNTLRSYQLEGVNWLLNRWYYKQSCIMADEMGLGKTVQSVTFVNSLFTEFEYFAPAIVVAPLSTIVHWEREFANWTDLRVLTYHGSIQARDVISNYEFFMKTGNTTVRLFDVIITTYEMAMAGADHLSQFEFGVGIFDEAHRLKNSNSKASVCLRNFKILHKVLLSGTPIQNNLTELWSLFNFIDTLRFNNINNFLNEFKMENADDVLKLQDLLKPLMLRRMKDDVETSIPMKEETIIEVELTMMQKRYYRAILEKNLEFLTKGDKSNAPNLINAMMELRKCCVHPFLINGAEEKIFGDYFRKRRIEESIDTSNYFKYTDNAIKVGDYHINDIDEYYKILIQSSGKLVLLDKLLNKLKHGHKVLIFSQMTKCLDLLGDYLKYRNFKYERIDGGVRGDLRQAAIDRFSTGDVFVFLLCTRAGGVGINLTAADTVVIFDSDWNPQNDLQAQARCHRIGQKNEVKIYRLVTKNSYEREMFDRAGLKLGLDKAILQKMHFNSDENGSENKAHHDLKKEDAIQLLLRKGAYGVLMETDDASQNFCEEDIDQILERRTKIIKHSESGNVFSKATFQIEEEVEDPDFWDNLLSQKKSEESEGRIKRQVRRLSREGVLSKENKVEIKKLYEEEAVSNKPKKEDFSKKYYKMFLSVLNGCLSEFNIDICSLTSSDKDNLAILKSLIKYNLDLILNQKLRSDFMFAMEGLFQEYDPSDFPDFSELYMKYHEQFLLKVQTPVILFTLTNSEEIVVEKARGWSHEDDRNLIDLVLKKGYDNFKYKDKDRDEINQRVRKIISVLSHKKEIRDNDNMYFKTIMNFGRITDLNELSIEKYLNSDLTKLRQLIQRITGMSKRSRRDSVESDCYDRILFFDKLEEMHEIPNIRRIGMPKKWDYKKDKDLRNYLLKDGFVGVCEKFDLSEELILKRFDSMFKTTEKPNESPIN